jgi:hypothetical protein
VILRYGDAIDCQILRPGPHVLRLLQALNKRRQTLPLDLLATRAKYATRYQISNVLLCTERVISVGLKYWVIPSLIENLTDFERCFMAARGRLSMAGVDGSLTVLENDGGRECGIE